MQLRHIGATLTATLAVVAGSTLVNAAPAAAVGGCPSDKLCLYRSTEYRTMSFAAASTSACFWLSDYGLTYPFNGISSYVNNLPVKATLWSGNAADPNSWYQRASIRSGGFSSDTFNGGDNNQWTTSDMVCTGSAKP
ncbi:peptidase inhibitor family I36 protein [Streptomyces sp. NPDC058239]|uniref:peptidase inhibitor family I36 protein n=1 Tax=unclassified Streptomyces TaxID=2593676 RepID=UPI003663FEAD